MHHAPMQWQPVEKPSRGKPLQGKPLVGKTSCRERVARRDT